MTRSSIVAAIVVALLLALLIWLRDESSRLERTTEALKPLDGARSARGLVRAVPAARSASSTTTPSIEPPVTSQGPTAVDAGDGRAAPVSPF
jgi:hypothetical protein